MSELGFESPGIKEPGKFLRFSNTVELGHVLQALVMLLMIGGWALVGYETIQKQLDQHAAEMALFKQRLAGDEALAADERNSERAAASETRQALGKISDQIADLRTLVAGQADGHRH